MGRQAFNFKPTTDAEREIYQLYDMVKPNSRDHWDILPDELPMELSCRGCHSGEFLGLIFNAPSYVYRMIMVPTFVIDGGHFDLRLTWEELTQDVPKFTGASDAIRRSYSMCTYEDKTHIFKGGQTLRHFKRRIPILLVRTPDRTSYVLKDPSCLDWLVCDRGKGGAAQEPAPVSWTKPAVKEQDKAPTPAELQRGLIQTLPLKQVLEQLQAIAKAEKLYIKITPTKYDVQRVKTVTEAVDLDDL